MGDLDYKAPVKCTWMPKEYCLECPYKEQCSKWSYYREGREDAIVDIEKILHEDATKYMPGKTPRTVRIELIKKLFRIRHDEEINMSDQTIRWIKSKGVSEW